MSFLEMAEFDHTKRKYFEMRKKKSAYADDISQECLLMGAKFLADPPTLINAFL